jgi:dolichol-phosphate mannosyltransferase
VSLISNLQEMERTREAYWRRYPGTSPTKLRWRAITVRHWFHALPTESVLELGAGSGLWTRHLTTVLQGENPVTAAVFNSDLAEQAIGRELPNTTIRYIDGAGDDLPPEGFDYVVGTAILSHDRHSENLRWIHRLLKPGGRLLFFEANYWNPQVLVKSVLPVVGRRVGNARCQIGMRRFRLMQALSHQGFTEIETTPYDIVHPRTPSGLIPAIQSAAFVLEHAPVVREACGTLYIAGKKPGDEARRRPQLSLARHPSLAGSTSVVVPCKNEAVNVPGLVSALTDAYDEYLKEIIIVDDASEDGTAARTRELGARDARVKLITRSPPAGVGRALRDGYAAATGDLILSMDCDFRLIVPELRDLFDAVASGRDGAIGSRFSHDSILVHYPFAKVVANRGFHVIARLVLRRPVRDISNNLKLYRADILRELEITRGDFAANVETGLKPILAGYDIVEVPISWIDRSDDMGASSFRLARLAPSYLLSLVGMLRARHTPASRAARGTNPSATGVI